MADRDLYELDQARVQLYVDDDERYLTISDTRVGGAALDEMPVDDQFVEAFLGEFEDQLVDD